MVERLNPAMSPSQTSPTMTDSDDERPYSRATDPALPAAYDLLEQMLLPDMTKRITARDALLHPFLVEMIDPDTVDGSVDVTVNGVEVRRARDPETGAILEALGDDIYAPKPLGQGICARGHWLDEETGEHCCFIVLGEAIQKSSMKERKNEADPTERSKEAAARSRRRQMKEERQRLKEMEHGILTAMAESWPEDPDSPDSRGVSRSVKVRVMRLAAGEGVAIGLDPCEFHQEAVVHASYWHSHRALVDSEKMGEGDMDEE